MAGKLLSIVIQKINKDYYAAKCLEFDTGSFGSSREDAIERVKMAVDINSNVMLSINPQDIQSKWRRLLPYARSVIENRQDTSALFKYL